MRSSSASQPRTQEVETPRQRIKFFLKRNFPSKTSFYKNDVLLTQRFIFFFKKSWNVHTTALMSNGNLLPALSFQRFFSPLGLFCFVYLSLPLPFMLSVIFFQMSSDTRCSFVLVVVTSCLFSQPHTHKTPWESPGKNTGAGCHFLLQGIFPTQGLNLCLLYGRFATEPLGKPNSSICNRL